LSARAGLALGVSRARVDELLRSGLKVHYFDAGTPDGVVEVPGWDAGIDLVITRIGVDTRGFDSVDLEILSLDGTLLKTIRDVQGDPHEGAVYAVCEAPLAVLALRTGATRTRFIGMRAGRRETITVFEARPAGK
jgi:hypothetical protein